MKEIFYKTNGVRRRVVSAFYKTGGVQRRIVKGYVKQNGVYRMFYEYRKDFSFTLIPGYYNENSFSEHFAGYAKANQLWVGSPAFGSVFGYSIEEHDIIDFFYAGARAGLLTGIFRGNLTQYGFKTVTFGTSIPIDLDASSLVYNATRGFTEFGLSTFTVHDFLRSNVGNAITVTFS